MTELPKRELLRPSEVATYFSVSVKTVYGWIAEGKIDAVKIGITRVIRIPRDSIKRLIRPVIE